MNLARLNTIRTRLIARAVGTTLVPALATGLSVVAVAAIADSRRGLPFGWRLVALSGLSVLAIAGAVLLWRAIATSDLTMLGIARYAAARSESGRNALLTYLENLQSGRAPAYVTARLEPIAEREAAALEPSVLVSLRRPTMAAALLAVAVLTLVVPIALGYDAVSRLVLLARDPVASAGSAEVAGAAPVDPGDRLSIRIVPPAYTGAAAQELQNPTEIAAISGSRIDVVVDPGVQGVDATLSLNGAEPAPMDHESDGSLVGHASVNTEGSIAVRSTSPAGERARFLLPLRVQPDRAPDVHITNPVRDQLVEMKSRPRSLTVSFEASDDFGLGEARFVYIRSIGEGDAAEFVDGTLPVAMNRSGGKATGSTVVDLDKLGIVAGATLVFHVEVQDRNSVAGPSTGMSETLVFEVASPQPPASVMIGELKPEDIQRFLTSERMILEHTLKLDAQRGKMPRDEFLRQSTKIAQDQHDFKESFDQFIEVHGANDHDHEGISLRSAQDYEKAKKAEAAAAAVNAADPTAKAEEAQEKAVEEKTEAHQHGAADGNKLNDPARELLYAVRAMWDAEGSLGIGETDKAIPSEKTAIEHLKKAQTAVRYFSRVRVTTKPVDLKRRYAGELADIKSRLDRIARQELAPDERPLRDALAQVFAMCREAAEPGAKSAAAVLEIGARAERASGELLAIKTGYEPAVVSIAAKLANASAAARRFDGARRDADEGRARSAETALNDALLSAASELGALLDRRGYVRGSDASAAPTTAARYRASVYTRRLAGAPK